MQTTQLDKMLGERFRRLRSDDLTPTAFPQLRWKNRIVPPGCSISHQGTIGQKTAVTALQPLLLLSDPDRVRPGWVIFTGPDGAGTGVRYFSTQILESF